MIALAMFALASIVLWRAAGRAGNWGYTASMPMIFGIGLFPLLQWLILPPAMVGAYRKLGPVLFGHRTEA